MDFLRVLAEDLQTLGVESKRKYPVVKEAVDKALQSVPYLQQQYATLLRTEKAPPGPGHSLFKCESVLRPFLLACNHTNASHKIVILALISIQRLVSWDAIEQTSVGSILRVLQIQAEKNNTQVDVQVKLLQTLLQLITLSYQDKSNTDTLAIDDNFDTKMEGNSTNEKIMVGNEDLVMQSVWICLLLYNSCQGSSTSIVSTTAAMTIRQIVSLVFGKISHSPEAKQVGVLVFQELCYLIREESTNSWLYRMGSVGSSNVLSSHVTFTLCTELLETIVGSNTTLFHKDEAFQELLKQQIVLVVHGALESSCVTKTNSTRSNDVSLSNASGTLPVISNGLNSSSSFPLLVRIMRLISTFLCNFRNVLAVESTIIVQQLLELIENGAYRSTPQTAGEKQSEVKSLLSRSLHLNRNTHNNISDNNGSLSTALNGVHYVTWPVILSLEVLNRLCSETMMIYAMAFDTESSSVLLIARTLASVVVNSPAIDSRQPSASSSSTTASVTSQSVGPNHSTDVYRSALDALNDQEAPPLVSLYTAIRLATTAQSALLTSLLDVAKSLTDNLPDSSSSCEHLALNCIAPIASDVLQMFNSNMTVCRDMELISMTLKSYHILATVASRLRMKAKCKPLLSATIKLQPADDQDDSPPSKWRLQMDDVVIACLRVLCAFSFPLPDRGNPLNSGGMPSSKDNSNPRRRSNRDKSDTSSYSEEFLSAIADVIASDDRQNEKQTGVSINDVYSTSSEGTTAVSITLSWREVYAMKALFGAAHIMEDELTVLEWEVLLEGFEIIAGITEARTPRKHQANSTSLKTRLLGGNEVDSTLLIQSLRLENEDIEQQVLMLSTSISDFFRNALKLSSIALRRLLQAVRQVCWLQTGIENSITSIPFMPTLELPSLLRSYQMQLYHHHLCVGVLGANPSTNSTSGTSSGNSGKLFRPWFSLRMLTQLALSSKNCFENVMSDLVAMSLAKNLTGSLWLQQFQCFTTDAVFELMQKALQAMVTALSPTAASGAANNTIFPHVFDQTHLFMPLVTLMRSHITDQALIGLLELLTSCGHLITTGWKLVLESIQCAVEVENGGIGNAKAIPVGSSSKKQVNAIIQTQVAAFKCLQLIVDDLLTTIPKIYLPNCIQCIGKVALCAKDVNISLTAVNELWSVADVIGKQTKTQKITPKLSEMEADVVHHWGSAFGELRRIALDCRAEVRNCAINTLFGTAVTYGAEFGLNEWELFLDATVLPLAYELDHVREVASTENPTSPKAATNGMIVHYSRDNAAKQWDESRVLVLNGIARVLETNCAVLKTFQDWFSNVWTKLLRHATATTTTLPSQTTSKEVVLAGISALQTLLHVASQQDFEAFLQNQPVRAGAGMRVVGGALVVTATPTAVSSNNPNSASPSLDPSLWRLAYDTLCSICDVRYDTFQKNTTLLWHDDDEQEIAGTVVLTLIHLYLTSKLHEFKQSSVVKQCLNVFDSLIRRFILPHDRTGEHVLLPPTSPSSKRFQVAANSLQSRVLNAYEEMQYLEPHPDVHELVLTHLTSFVSKATSPNAESQSTDAKLVYFTRHALQSLAKMYPRSSKEAQQTMFYLVLTTVRPLLELKPRTTNTESSDMKKRAEYQLWKQALDVLLTLIHNGLTSISFKTSLNHSRGDSASYEWIVLLQVVERLLFLPQKSETNVKSSKRAIFNSNWLIRKQFVQSDEDEALLRSTLEATVMTSLKILQSLNEPWKSHVVDYCEQLLLLLSNGVNNLNHVHQTNEIVQCCVNHLSLLATTGNSSIPSQLITLSRAHLVQCSRTAVELYTQDEDTDYANGDNPLISTHSRAVLVLNCLIEVNLPPRYVMEIFSALCACITCNSLEVRQIVQKLLYQSRLSEYCLQLVALHDSNE